VPKHVPSDSVAAIVPPGAVASINCKSVTRMYTASLRPAVSRRTTRVGFDRATRSFSLRPLFRQDWVVYAKPAFGGPAHDRSREADGHRAFTLAHQLVHLPRYFVGQTPNRDHQNARPRVPAAVCPQQEITAKISRKTSGSPLPLGDWHRSSGRAAPSSPAPTRLDRPRQQQNPIQTP
jgi:hypothetical protein